MGLRASPSNRPYPGTFTSPTRGTPAALATMAASQIPASRTTRSTTVTDFELRVRLSDILPSSIRSCSAPARGDVAAHGRGCVGLRPISDLDPPPGHGGARPSMQLDAIFAAYRETMSAAQSLEAVGSSRPQSQ